MQELKGTEKKKIQDFTFWTNWFFCWIYQIRHFPSPEWRYIPTYLRRCPSLACLDGRCLSKVPSVVWMTKKDFIFNAKRWTQDGQTDQFWWITKPREFYFINFITLSLSLSLTPTPTHTPLYLFMCTITSFFHSHTHLTLRHLLHHSNTLSSLWWTWKRMKKTFVTYHHYY